MNSTIKMFILRFTAEFISTSIIMYSVIYISDRRYCRNKTMNDNLCNGCKSRLLK